MPCRFLFVVFVFRFLFLLIRPLFIPFQQNEGYTRSDDCSEYDALSHVSKLISIHKTQNGSKVVSIIDLLGYLKTSKTTFVSDLNRKQSEFIQAKMGCNMSRKIKPMKPTPAPKIKFQSISDQFNTIDEVSDALREQGLDACQLIVGIDFTKTNNWAGNATFGGASKITILSKIC